MDFLTQLLVFIATQVVAYALTPKPKNTQTSNVQEIEAPTASAGSPIPEVFYRKTVKSPNVLWYGEKSSNEYQVKV